MADAQPVENDVPAMCDTEEVGSGARCYKGPGHDGPHNGWAHYPAQLASWDTSVLPPGSTDRQETA